jgi:arylformamidase
MSTLQSEIDRAYDNAAAFPDVPTWRTTWQDRNEKVSIDRAHIDVSYGAVPRQKLDIFPCERVNAPTALFFHGGFWSRNSKETFRYVVHGIHAAGFNAVFVGYTLAPEARIDRITQEAREAVAWTHAHLQELQLARRPLVVVGWSAGAQLAAMVMDEPYVNGGIGVSGIYDLEPMRSGSINGTLNLDRLEALRNSPATRLPANAGRFITAYGDQELPAFRDQSEEFHSSWIAAGLDGELIALPGHHHHSGLDELYRTDGLLTRRLAGLAESKP